MVLKMPNGDDADKKPAKVCAEGTQESILWRKAAEVGKIPRTLCNWKKIRKIEAEACPDHVQMLAEVPGMEMQASRQGILVGTAWIQRERKRKR